MLPPVRRRAPPPPSWAVASDFSDIVFTDDGFGAFVTKQEALERQISYLLTEREQNTRSLATARRRLRTERKKAST